MKYRKKPVEVEAIRLGWDTWNEVCDFVPKERFGGGKYLDDRTLEMLPEGEISNTMGLILKPINPTRSAVAKLVIQGDWLVRGEDDIVNVLTNEVFEATYEPVEDFCLSDCKMDKED